MTKHKTIGAATFTAWAREVAVQKIEEATRFGEQMAAQIEAQYSKQGDR